MQWIEGVRARTTIADLTEKANEQHYEVSFPIFKATRYLMTHPQVSTNFILSCLGYYAKYSSCYYPSGKETLDEAEILMMESYCTKAKLADGQHILDLGCGTSTGSRLEDLSLIQKYPGWGSLSLYLAQVRFRIGLRCLNTETYARHVRNTQRHKSLVYLTQQRRKHISTRLPWPGV